MFISKKEKELFYGSIAAVAKEIKSLEKRIEEIEKKLPEYEEAVAKGVDDVWNKAVQGVIDFNPYKDMDGGDE